MQMLGGRASAGASSGGEAEYGGSMPSSGGGAGGQGAVRSAPAKKAPSFEDMDDDIPF
jgi:single-stranded DNA-binding protein